MKEELSEAQSEALFEPDASSSSMEGALAVRTSNRATSAAAPPWEERRPQPAVAEKQPPPPLDGRVGQIPTSVRVHNGGRGDGGEAVLDESRVGEVELVALPHSASASHESNPRPQRSHGDSSSNTTTTSAQRRAAGWNAGGYVRGG